MIFCSAIDVASLFPFLVKSNHEDFSQRTEGNCAYFRVFCHSLKWCLDGLVNSFLLLRETGNNTKCDFFSPNVWASVARLTPRSWRDILPTSSVIFPPHSTSPLTLNIHRMARDHAHKSPPKHSPKPFGKVFLPNSMLFSSPASGRSAVAWEGFICV